MRRHLLRTLQIPPRSDQNLYEIDLQPQKCSWYVKIQVPRLHDKVRPGQSPAGEPKSGANTIVVLVDVLPDLVAIRREEVVSLHVFFDFRKYPVVILLHCDLLPMIFQWMLSCTRALPYTLRRLLPLRMSGFSQVPYPVPAASDQKLPLPRICIRPSSSQCCNILPRLCC